MESPRVWLLLRRAELGALTPKSRRWSTAQKEPHRGMLAVTGDCPRIEDGKESVTGGDKLFQPMKSMEQGLRQRVLKVILFKLTQKWVRLQCSRKWDLPLDCLELENIVFAYNCVSVPLPISVLLLLICFFFTQTNISGIGKAEYKWRKIRSPRYHLKKWHSAIRNKRCIGTEGAVMTATT